MRKFEVMKQTIRFSAALLILLLAAAPALSDESQPFSEWLAELRQEASQKGISTETLDAALASVAPIEKVIQLDRNQPEFKLGLNEYLSRYVSGTRVAEGRRQLAAHRELLDEIYERFGVQPRFVVALWGIESRFGQQMGSYRVVDALATLAHEGRRAKFFRGQLIDALTIIDEGHIEADKMLGSWAGAMGQPQFMPSSFRAYAVDGDGDGRRNIWSSTADVFGSASNYLSSFGWRSNQTWGRKVQLPDGFDRSLIGRKTKRRLASWQSVGVRLANGDDLPQADLYASLIQPDDEADAYIVYSNFRTILRWNNSEYFGLAVGLLADKLVAEAP